MQNQYIGTAALAALLLATPVNANDQAITGYAFVQKAAVANQFEIETSKLALAKSQNEAIRSFAQKMIDDHTQAGKKLHDTLAMARSTISLPNALDDKHHKLLAQLQADKVERFDQDYVQQQKTAHAKAVQLFGTYAEHGDNPSLQQFARETLPTLKAHREHVRQLAVNNP